MANTRTHNRHLSVFQFATILVVCLMYQYAGAQTQSDWQQRWDKVVSSAKKEGQVVVLGPPGDLIRDAITQGFKKAFPDISIEFSGGRGAEQATKLQAERAGGIYSADVMITGPTSVFGQLKPAGMIDPIKPALILPEVAEPKYWAENSLIFNDREGIYNLRFTNQIIPPVLYDPKQVKVEEIDELYELLNPKWKGKLAINDPIPGGAGYVQFQWIWQALGPDKAADYYRKVRAQAGIVDRDLRRLIEWVAQGKYALLLGPSTLMEQLRQRGLKFGILPEFKDYGGAYVSGSFGSMVLLNKAPNPNAATVFLNWFLSKEGQTAWSKAALHVSHRVDVPKNHLSSYLVPKPGRKYWQSDSEQNVERSAQELQLLKQLFGR